MNKLLIFVGVLMTGCSRDLGVDLIENDRIALEGMMEALAGAQNYNDTLAAYINSEEFPEDSVIHFYDDHYHLHDSLFLDHHNHFSHLGTQTDHHHDDHGIHHEDHVSGHSELILGHHQEDHHAMDSLQNVHGDYHPVD